MSDSGMGQDFTRINRKGGGFLVRRGGLNTHVSLQLLPAKGTVKKERGTKHRAERQAEGASQG